MYTAYCNFSIRDPRNILLPKTSRAPSLEGMLYRNANYTHDGKASFASLTDFDITKLKLLAKPL